MIMAPQRHTTSTNGPLSKAPGSTSSRVEVAAEAEDFELAAALLRSCNPFEVDERGDTPLMWAAKLGLPNLVAELLPISDPCAHNNEMETAIVLAASLGHASCVKVLLPHSDLLDRSSSGGSPIEHAASEGHLDCLTLFTSAPAIGSGDLRSAQLGLCAQRAAGRGNVDCLRHLMALGALDDTESMMGALCGAARNGCAEILCELLGKSHDSEMIGAALVEAARSFHPAGSVCISLLADAMMPGSARHHCLVALRWSAGHGNFMAIEKILTLCAWLDSAHAYGADFSVLSLAAQGGHLRCVELLLPAANLDSVDHNGCAASRSALVAGFPEIAKLIGSERAKRENLSLHAQIPKPRATRLAPRV